MTGGCSTGVFSTVNGSLTGGCLTSGLADSHTGLFIIRKDEGLTGTIDIRRGNL